MPRRLSRLALLAAALLVAAAGAGAQRAVVPAPRDVLGFEPGTDYTLADFRQLREYMRRLDAASERVQVYTAGRSTEGNEMLVAVISSEANLARLDRYRDIARRLALVRGLDDESARELAGEGKAIVWIDNGLHASEVATAQHALVLAHRVATDDSPAMREIRDNVILVLLPCINPDGMNMVVDWYRRNLRTPYQDSPMPWLYQKYVGHDNNRDSYMATQAETEVVNRLLYEEWLPEVMYNQHQGTWPPRIFVPPFPDPVNPNIDPQVMRGVDLVGGAMQDRFEREGKDGVISRYQFSVWYNGSVRTTTYFHNIIGILTETGHASATPHEYRAADFPETLSNGVPTLAPSVTYPHPWKGGTLRLRDAMDYMLTGSLAVLEVAAKYRERLLYGIYQVGARQIDRGLHEAPIAYVIPQAQHDRSSSARFIETLMKGGVEVHVARAPFTADGTSFQAGTYVVLMAQPFRAYAKDLFEAQRYPDLRTHPGGPPIPPYDIAGWTLAYQMGVESSAISTPFETSSLARIASSPTPAGMLAGDAQRARWGVAIDPRDNDAFRAVNRLLAAGLRVERAAAPLTVGATTLPPGAWIVEARARRTEVLRHGQADARGAGLPPPREASADRRSQGEGGQSCSTATTAEALVSCLGLRAQRLGGRPRVRTIPVRAARVGLYRSFVANIDEGWTRWLLERYEFPYVPLTNRDVREGNLRAKVDVVILPDQTPRQILDGHQPGQRPSTPGPWSPPPPEYQGGIGDEGAAALATFVRQGGTLVALDEAADLVLARFGGPFAGITDIVEGRPRTEFYCPGSVLRIVSDPAAPGAFGMAAEAGADFINSRAFATTEPTVRSLAVYAPASRLLMSGWLLGGPVIAGQHAAIEVPFGAGRVVLIAFRSQFRAQPHGTFKLLFNALYGSS